MTTFSTLNTCTQNIGSLRKQYQDIKIKFSSLKHNVSFIASSVEAIPNSLARNEKTTRNSVNTRSGLQMHTEQVYHNQDNTYYNSTCVIKGVPVKELRETVARKRKSDTIEREFKVSEVKAKTIRYISLETAAIFFLVNLFSKTGHWLDVFHG